MLRVFSPTCFNVNSPLTLGFESGFTGFSGLQRTSSFLAQCLFVDVYFSPFFSPMRYASAGGLALKAACNNNLPTHTNDVMVNPENPVNPDSKLAAARLISNQDCGGACFWGIVCHVNHF
jgi:hypothetical protein